MSYIKKARQFIKYVTTVSLVSVVIIAAIPGLLRRVQAAPSESEIIAYVKTCIKTGKYVNTASDYVLELIEDEVRFKEALQGRPPEFTIDYPAHEIGQFLDYFGKWLELEEIAISLGKGDYKTAITDGSKFVFEEFLEYHFPDTFGAAFGVAQVANIPIKYALNKFIDNVFDTAFDNQVRAYIKVRDMGFSHDYILDGQWDPADMVIFSDDGWLMYAGEYRVPDLAARPYTYTPTQVYNAARDIYEAELALAAQEQEKMDFFEQYLASLEPAIQISPEEPYAPVDVNFSTGGQALQGMNIVSYAWDFGDNTTAAGENVTHFYNKPGRYTVTLTMQDAAGASHELTRTLTVRPPDIEMAAPDGYNSMRRVFSTPSSPYVAQYTWDFDDDSDSVDGRVQDHIFQAAGDYTVRLTLTLTDGSTLIASEELFSGAGPYYVKGHDIDSKEIWRSGAVYVIEDSIHIKETGTLIIESGAVVKFVNSSGLIVAGTLLAEGAILTSVYDDEYGGDTNHDGSATLPGGENYWTWIAFTSTNTGSILKNCHVRYASRGVRISGGSPSIIDNTFLGVGTTNSSWRGIELSSSVENPKVTGNRISHFYDAIYVSHPNLTVFLLGGNVVQDCKHNGIYVYVPSKVSPSLSRSAIWTAELPYIIGNSSLSIFEGVALTLEPGTVIKFMDGHGLSVSGTLSADGAVLTHYADDSYGGDTNGDGGARLPGGENYWVGVALTSTNTGSILKNCHVRYASRGVRVFGGSPSIIDNIFLGVGTTNPSWRGIGLYSSVENPKVTGNRISHFYDAIYVSHPNLTVFLLGGNVVQDCKHNGIYVYVPSKVSPSLSRSAVWTAELPYIIGNSSLNILEGVTLTLESGTVVKFMNGLGLSVSGTLSADRAVLTNYADDSHGGDTNGDGNATQAGGTNLWRGIRFSRESTQSSLTNNTILYTDKAIDVYDTQVVILNNTILFSQDGIEVYGETTLTGNTLMGLGVAGSKGIYVRTIRTMDQIITANTIKDYEFGIDCYGTTTTPTIANNIFKGT